MSHEKNPFIHLSDKRFESSSLSQKYKDLFSLFFGNDFLSTFPLPTCEKIELILGQTPDAYEPNVLYIIKNPKGSKNSEDSDNVTCRFDGKIIRQFQLNHSQWMKYLCQAAIENETIDLDHLYFFKNREKFPESVSNDTLYVLVAKTENPETPDALQLTFYHLRQSKNQLGELDECCIPSTLIESCEQIIRIGREKEGSFTINPAQHKNFYALKAGACSNDASKKLREYPLLAKGDKFHFGLFDYLGAFFLRKLSVEAWALQEEIIAAELKNEYKLKPYLLQFGVGLLFWPLFLVYFAAAFIAFMLSAPFVPIVHFFFQRKETDHKKTPVRKSLFLNPATWVLVAILFEAMSLLIQGVNATYFSQTAGFLLMVQVAFAAMAGLAILFSIAYGLYRMIYALYSACSNSDAARDFYSLEPEKQFENRNVITHYLKERLTWIEAHFFESILIIGFGVILFTIALSLTIDYFTGSMLPNTLIAHIFDFMSNGFLSSIHGIMDLLGMEFPSGLSDVTLLMATHILSAITLLSTIFFFTDGVLRACAFVTEDVLETQVDQIDPQVAASMSVIDDTSSENYSDVLASSAPLEASDPEEKLQSIYYKNI